MKKLIILPFLLSYTFSVAQGEIEEQRPRFPDSACEELTLEEEKHNCSQQALLQFVYKNLQYPADAATNQIEGTVVVSFIIGIDGYLYEPEVIRSIYPSIDDEALRIIDLINEMEEPWVPGIQGGEAVEVPLHFPIKFKLR